MSAPNHSAPTPAKADETTDLREALDYLRMPDVTGAKYAVVPVKGDRDALAVVEAHIAQREAAHAAEIQAREAAEVRAALAENVAGIRKAEAEAHEVAMQAVADARRSAEARADQLAAENAVLKARLHDIDGKCELVRSIYATEPSATPVLVANAFAVIRDAARAALPEAITHRETSDGQN